MYKNLDVALPSYKILLIEAFKLNELIEPIANIP